MSPGGLPNVTADLRRAAQVLNNLLTNAAKYSPSSSPITVAAAQDPDSAFITFSVTDDGMGIQEDQLPHLFKKFSRGGDGVGRIAGDGLGLAICKGIVEAHGGRIWAENGGEEGRGARFRFTMPIAEAAEESKESNEPDFGQKKDLRTARIGERTRILTVDDEPQILRSLRNVLTGAGYVQFGTGDPDEAMHFVNIEAPHVIILDLILPGSHGFDLMRRIREVSDAPIIFLSAHDAEENIVKAFQMGADDYVVKPFSPAELLARIEASLRKARRTRPSRDAAPLSEDGLEDRLRAPSCNDRRSRGEADRDRIQAALRVVHESRERSISRGSAAPDMGAVGRIG